jgi:hypothetical protein
MLIFPSFIPILETQGMNKCPRIFKWRGFQSLNALFEVQNMLYRMTKIISNSYSELVQCGVCMIIQLFILLIVLKLSLPYFLPSRYCKASPSELLSVVRQLQSPNPKTIRKLHSLIVNYHIQNPLLEPKASWVPTN